MPANVVRFEQFAYASLALGFVGVLIQLGLELRSSMETPTDDLAILFGLLLITFGTSILLIWLASRRRRNWARCMIFVLFILGLPVVAMDIWGLLRTIPLVAIIFLAQAILQAIALRSVFTGDANAWFGPAYPAD